MEVPADDEVEDAVQEEHGEDPGEAELRHNAVRQVVPPHPDLELLREHDVLVPEAVGRD